MDTLGHIVRLRTYADMHADGTRETWRGTAERSANHTHKLFPITSGERREFVQRMTNLLWVPAGRTMKHADKEHATSRACCNFNCAGLQLSTPSDFAEAFWLQLNGCGVGATIKPSMFLRHAPLLTNVTIKRSDRGPNNRGEEHTHVSAHSTGGYRIRFGDSAEGWAEGIRHLLLLAPQTDELYLDLSEIRGAGGIMGRYGWRSSGDQQLSLALENIVNILRDGDGPLSRTSIHKIFNWLGTALANRRSAQIVLCRYDDADWKSFATLKLPGFEEEDWYLASSNNTTSFNFVNPPSDAILDDWMHHLSQSAGGAETGLLNEAEARRRAPWFEVFNPCSEIMLPHKGFCNLVDVAVSNHTSFEDLKKTVNIAARHNYRQTLVAFEDGHLSKEWTDHNDMLRLCGVGLTGLASSPFLTPDYLRELRRVAWVAVSNMAKDVGKNLPVAVTTIKPSGTVSKVLGVSSGLHRDLAPYMLYNINFHKHDPLLKLLDQAGYPIRDTSMGPVVSIPKHHPGDYWATNEDNIQYNHESAINQLERYRMVMNHYVDHNASITVSYDDDELPAIKNWIQKNWKEIVAVSFMRRVNPFDKQGFEYLPQEPITKDQYDRLTGIISDPDWDSLGPDEDYTLTLKECEGGACPAS